MRLSLRSLRFSPRCKRKQAHDDIYQNQCGHSVDDDFDVNNDGDDDDDDQVQSLARERGRASARVATGPQPVAHR